MTVILIYLRGYFAHVDKGLLLFCSIWTAVLIALNYQLGIERTLIANLDSRFYQFLALFCVYCCAFVVPYLFIAVFRKPLIVITPLFWWLLLMAPALFAFKVSVVNPLEYGLAGIWGDYWVAATTLPFKFLTVLAPLIVLHRMLAPQTSFWGMTLQNLRWRPYLQMLVLMVPLILFASTQPDFLSVYPRGAQIAFITAHTDYWHGILLKALYEISYGIDFVTIELFFRGFLIFAFTRFAGAAAILPMAVFYCSIHFGKPLLECVSSFFGGLILGVVAYRTQSIVGGLAVHLGVAWMMEIGGYVGNGMLRGKG